VTHAPTGAVSLEMRLALALPLALLATACGSAQAPRPPAAAPPEAAAGGPPRAWIETKAGSRWLGFSTYCWTRTTPKGRAGTCADAIAPTCDQPQVPKVPVEQGETVRAHLGFAPAEASVLGRQATLRGRSVEWQIDSAGTFVVFARAKDGNDASYAGCAILERS
jgi:hypothetical protein